MDAIQIQPVWIEIGGPALLAGLLIGTLIGWLIFRSRQRRLEELNRLLETKVKDQDAIQAERDSAYEAATTRLATAFSELSSQSLKANSETFLRLAEQNLGAQQERAKRELGNREQAVENLVKPIREALTQSQQQIAALEKARSEAYGGIKSQLESMQTSQQNLAQETQNLVNALPQTRRCVAAGAKSRSDGWSNWPAWSNIATFRSRFTRASDDKIIRPDMIVRMPDRRELVVDVKTPLDAYLEAAEAKDDAQRELGLKRHARNVREHIRKLSSKAYWEQFSESPEFVILFIPGDQFLSAALNEEPDLIESALSQQIILATPTSFVALLKAVAYGWRQLALADNAEEIRHLAEDLYGRLATFVGHLNKVGKQLSSSVDNYNRAMGSLERKVLPGARKFVELGVHPKKEIESIEPLEALPRSMVEPQNDNDDDPADKKTLQ